jgi:hypothetical protein
MEYHVGRNGTQLGIFSDDKLREGFANGSIALTDLVWCEGMDDWAPVSEILKIAVEVPAQPAVEKIQAAGLAAVSEPVVEEAAGLSAVAEPVPAPPAVVRPPAVPLNLPAPNLPSAAVSPEFTGAVTSGTAIASLVLGLMSFVLGCLTGLPAVICGHIALSQANRSNGMVGGKGMAIAGLVLGYVGILFGTAILAGLAMPAFTTVQEKARIMEASNNVRQIIISMKSYADDHDGKYPDADASNPKTANDAFRVLIKEGLLNDERVFTAAGSAFKGDDNIGVAPGYEEALQPGENHWALTKGASDSSESNLPVVYDAPVVATWPPVWNADARGRPVPGRAWKSGKVIIGVNDGSVQPLRLAAPTGAEVPAAPLPGGKPVFDPAKPHEILMPAR